MTVSTPSVSDVRAIMPEIADTVADAQITALISTAARIVATCVASYDAELQADIVKWVTAHMIASTTIETAGSLTSRKLGDAADTFARAPMGEGMKATTYGQTALMLDTNGCLVNLGKVRVFAKVY